MPIASFPCTHFPHSLQFTPFSLLLVSDLCFWKCPSLNCWSNSEFLKLLSDPTSTNVRAQCLQENYSAASQALEQALSLDFEIREWPQYNLLRSRVLTGQGDYDEALIVLEHALSLAQQSKMMMQGSGNGYSRSGLW